MELEDIYRRILSAENYRVLIVPFALMVIDFCTGLFHAWATGHLKSYKMREGLNKKVAEISIIIIGLLFTWAFNIPYYIISCLIIYVILMELLSICENLDKMGVPIPNFIRKALHDAEHKIQNGSKGDDSNDL